MHFRDKRLVSDLNDPGAASIEDAAERFVRLLDDARAGSAAAAAELVDQYRPYLLAVANQELDSDLRAKIGPSDLVQESLITAQNSIVDFRGESADDLLAWCRKILANDLLEVRREYRGAAKRNVDREIPLGGGGHLSKLAGDVADERNTPGAAAIAKEEARQLNDAMSRLSSEHRQVLQLRNWEQLAFAEIGKQMNRSSEAARKLWSRAVVRLQQELSADGGQTRPESD
jgi:RNA polymerase sigma-70 factor (ECF subfamily)